MENDPERAWRLVRTIVGCAPDYHILAAVAAGPMEQLIDRHGETVLPAIAEEAKRNARLPICLGAAYSEFPPVLQALVEGETADVRDLAVDPQATLGGEPWLHHSDTAWSSEFLAEMTDHDPAGAWDVLRVLAAFADEDARIRLQVFEDAFAPFVRRHFHAYRTSGRPRTP